MNELLIPTAPQWYNSAIFACAPDGTLVYGAKNKIIIAENGDLLDPEKYKSIPITARGTIINAISLNKKWKEPHRYIVCLTDDNIVTVWDLDTLKKTFTNKSNVQFKETLVASIFAGDDRIVSVTSHGVVNVWNIHTNETKHLKDLFKFKVLITCLSSCPHAPWMLAFGLSNGCVVVADLRRDGRVMYRLRGHQQGVVSLTWCPAPVNVFPEHVQNTVKNKSAEIESNEVLIPEVEDITISSVSDNEGASKSDISLSNKIKPSKKNPWTNLVHADDDEQVEELEFNLIKHEIGDFLKDCDLLKKQILGLKLPKEGCALESEPETPLESRKKLVAKKHNKKTNDVEGGRSLPRVYDPSCDFVENSIDNSNDDISEDKDFGNEKECEEVTTPEEENDQNLPPTDKSNDDNLNIQQIDNSIITFKGRKEEDGAGEPTLTVKSAEISANGANKSTEGAGDASVTVKAQESIEEDPRIEYLLASSGRDRCICIWRAGTDGRMQTFFQLPKKNRSRDNKNNCWVSACWVTPDTIVTSSLTGDLLAWTLPKPKALSKQYRSLHYEHTLTVFNIVTPPKIFTEYNWKNNPESATIWSYGQEGLLVKADLQTTKIELTCSVISGIITGMDSAPWDPNRIVFGQSDSRLRFWNLSRPNSTTITMQKIQQKITGRITTVSWHPSKEMVVAFGNDEGVVGVADLTSKKTTILRKYFHTTIYKVEWGPIGGEKTNLGLYAVSDGKIVIYDTGLPSNEPILLDIGAKLFIYKFSWKPDFDCLLINIVDGSVIILKTDLTLLTTVYFNDKCLNSSVWHPDTLCEDSERKNWFAAPTVKGFLIYNCHLTVEQAQNYLDNIVGTFEGHLKSPNCLAWNPFDGNQILSCASDGFTHIWNVAEKCRISTYFDATFTLCPFAMWSPLNSDLIILAEKYVRIWSISKYPPQSDEEILAKKKTVPAKDISEKPEKTENKIKVEIPASEKNTKTVSYIVPQFYVSSERDFEKQVEAMRNFMESQKEDKCEEIDPLRIFGGKEDVLELLTMNYVSNKKDSRSKTCELIALWKGNIAECVKDAINENRVTPTIIALAPMVSPKLWQDACGMYAQKLSENSNSDPVEAAMYFLACHKVEEALKCLCDNQMFREALALAKCRLPEDSEIIEQVMEKWISYCIQTGNFELATYCYISTKQYEKAAKTLSRRNNKVFLEFALELAEKAENKELCEFIKFKISSKSENNNEAAEVSEKELPSRIDLILEKAESDKLSHIEVSEDSLEKEAEGSKSQIEESEELEIKKE